ncbi:hypothetical protein BaRGS_00002532 [Batillaria attramentaria]|uniref:Uncharacterized protein n=1 Tax=Batillaria attramentaria TaxID=370345 RepID=A0ABD0M3E5_9CAEN
MSLPGNSSPHIVRHNPTVHLKFGRHFLFYSSALDGDRFQTGLQPDGLSGCPVLPSHHAPGNMTHAPRSNYGLCSHIVLCAPNLQPLELSNMLFVVMAVMMAMMAICAGSPATDLVSRYSSVFMEWRPRGGHGSQPPTGTSRVASPHWTTPQSCFLHFREEIPLFRASFMALHGPKNVARGNTSFTQCAKMWP